ncbi:hypothetical protein IFR05_009899 [Cadophora sp. M221]|nr:hypothetical protein IFR05_009899 [Cadophora sp. M221]
MFNRFINLISQAVGNLISILDMESQQSQEDVSDRESQPLTLAEWENYGKMRAVVAPASTEGVSSASGVSTQASASLLSTDKSESRPTSFHNQQPGPHQSNGILIARLPGHRSLSNQSQPQSSSPRDKAGPKKTPSEEGKSRLEGLQPATEQTGSRAALDISRHTSLSGTEESDAVQVYGEKDDLFKVAEHELAAASSG